MINKEQLQSFKLVKNALDVCEKYLGFSFDEKVTKNFTGLKNKFESYQLKHAKSIESKEEIELKKPLFENKSYINKLASLSEEIWKTGSDLIIKDLNDRFSVNKMILNNYHNLEHKYNIKNLDEVRQEYEKKLQLDSAYIPSNIQEISLYLEKDINITQQKFFNKELSRGEALVEAKQQVADFSEMAPAFEDFYDNLRNITTCSSIGPTLPFINSDLIDKDSENIIRNYFIKNDNAEEGKKKAEEIINRLYDMTKYNAFTLFVEKFKKEYSTMNFLNSDTFSKVAEPAIKELHRLSRLNNELLDKHKEYTAYIRNDYCEKTLESLMPEALATELLEHPEDHNPAPYRIADMMFFSTEELIDTYFSDEGSSLLKETVEIITAEDLNEEKEEKEFVPSDEEVALLKEVKKHKELQDLIINGYKNLDGFNKDILNEKSDKLVAQLLEIRDRHIVSAYETDMMVTMIDKIVESHKEHGEMVADFTALLTTFSSKVDEVDGTKIQNFYKKIRGLEQSQNIEFSEDLESKLYELRENNRTILDYIEKYEEYLNPEHNVLKANDILNNTNNWAQKYIKDDKIAKIFEERIPIIQEDEPIEETEDETELEEVKEDEIDLSELNLSVGAINFEDLNNEEYVNTIKEETDIQYNNMYKNIERFKAHEQMLEEHLEDRKLKDHASLIKGEMTKERNNERFKEEKQLRDNKGVNPRLLFTIKDYKLHKELKEFGIPSSNFTKEDLNNKEYIEEISNDTRDEFINEYTETVKEVKPVIKPEIIELPAPIKPEQIETVKEVETVKQAPKELVEELTAPTAEEIIKEHKKHLSIYEIITEAFDVKDLEGKSHYVIGDFIEVSKKVLGKKLNRDQALKEIETIVNTNDILAERLFEFIGSAKSFVKESKIIVKHAKEFAPNDYSDYYNKFLVEKLGDKTAQKTREFNSYVKSNSNLVLANNILNKTSATIKKYIKDEDLAKAYTQLLKVKQKRDAIYKNLKSKEDVK